MLKLTAIICVVLFASASHAMFIQDAEKVFYTMLKDEAEEVIEQNIELMREEHNNTITNVVKLLGEQPWDILFNAIKKEVETEVHARNTKAKPPKTTTCVTAAETAIKALKFTSEDVKKCFTDELTKKTDTAVLTRANGKIQQAKKKMPKCQRFIDENLGFLGAMMCYRKIGKFSDQIRRDALPLLELTDSPETREILQEKCKSTAMKELETGINNVYAGFEKCS